jgi:hypothetical protein
MLIMIGVMEGGFDRQMTPVTIKTGDSSGNIGGVCMKQNVWPPGCFGHLMTTRDQDSGRVGINRGTKHGRRELELRQNKRS